MKSIVEPAFADSTTTLRRGFTLEVTPVPIPNTAVKLQRADDTSSDRGGKVGRRDVKFKTGRSNRAARSACTDENH